MSQGRLNELLSLVRSRPELLQKKSRPNPNRNPENSDEKSAETRKEEEFHEDVLAFLRKCQKNLEICSEMLSKDSKDLQTIEVLMERDTRRP